MSLIDENLKLDIDKQLGVKNEPSAYMPSEEEKAIRSMIIRHFTLGNQNMYTPRVEFNDLATIYRDQVDQMAFNTYQPNNGDPAPGDVINGWRSRAIKPIVRNKCISTGAHILARMAFPKVFAKNNQDEEQKDAALVMESLMEYANEQANYLENSLYAVIQAEVAPACIVHTEYSEVYREVKREKGEDGKWKKEKICDETLSGFKDSIVPVDQLYIENFYERDIQKQGWLLWRRVQSFSLLETKYKELYPEKWKYVRPGLQLLYNDANNQFYYVYDPNMRPYMCEEVIYWNKSMDLRIILVNGVMLTDHDCPNPRYDKQYPFAKFGYEQINSRCFYYKSLAFKTSHDAAIVNTLYPMIIDGTYLNVMPPLINQGGEAIGSDVIIPGAVTTLSDPNASLTAIKASSDLNSGINALFKVEQSIEESSKVDVFPAGGGKLTAYEVAKREQERNTELKFFVNMIGSYVRQLGELRKGDILQYLTIADVKEIIGKDSWELVYKKFLLPNKVSDGKKKTRKIKFDSSLPLEPQTEEQQLELSYETLKMAGGHKGDTELYRVNPEIFRALDFKTTISDDVLNPLSQEVERAFSLEEYDRAIQNPLVDQEQVTRDLLLGAYQKTATNVDKYIKKAEPMQAAGGMPTGAPQDLASIIASKVAGGSEKPNLMQLPPEMTN